MADYGSTIHISQNIQEKEVRYVLLLEMINESKSGGHEDSNNCGHIISAKPDAVNQMMVTYLWISEEGWDLSILVYI